MDELSSSGEPVHPDHLGLALRAMGVGTLAGVAVVSAVMWLVRLLQAQGAAPLAPTPADPIANLVLVGWLGGAIAGAGAAWIMMCPIDSAYRRGGLSMVAGFATLLVSFITAPVDSLLGRWGLLGLVVLCAGLAFWLARPRAQRLGGPS